MLLFGAIAAMVLSGFALLERAASIGNGFLVLEFVAIGVLICIPLSIAAACWVFFALERARVSYFPKTRAAPIA